MAGRPGGGDCGDGLLQNVLANFLPLTKVVMRNFCGHLYDLNKVLNEADFMPLAILHDVWLGARLVRQWRGRAALRH